MYIYLVCNVISMDKKIKPLDDMDRLEWQHLCGSMSDAEYAEARSKQYLAGTSYNEIKAQYDRIIQVAIGTPRGRYPNGLSTRSMDDSTTPDWLYGAGQINEEMYKGLIRMEEQMGDLERLMNP
jgi:hypothetical protein